MLLKLISRLITTRLFLNSASCIMGFFMWYTISEFRILTITHKIPVYFDNVSQEQQIDAPEEVDITLSGTARQLYKSQKIGALHFNAHKLSPGKQLIHISPENLLLPHTTKVVNYTPIEVTFTTF